VKNANPVSSWLVALGAAFLALTAAGCGQGGSAGGASEHKTIVDHFPVAVGGAVASLQVAVLESEQIRGLMQRPDLGRDEGMIFVYERPQVLSIWMRNTPEPLDLAYLTSDGTVAETYALLPLDERPVVSHGSQIQFALEMPGGWYAAHGVRPGSRVDMKAMAAALTARGFDPEKFGIR
jgi:uncharacterized membrane protein (UPF0127 family)